MKTQNFFVKMKSDALAPILDELIIELENDFEELLRREVKFVKQCYRNGSKIWWRKFFHVGLTIPAEDVIKHCILSQTHLPFWMCLNPNVMTSANNHFKMKSHYLKIDLKYARQLLLYCGSQKNINIMISFVQRHSVLRRNHLK